jgi:viroplasmin and RNaseH domain-containing protein
MRYYTHINKHVKNVRVYTILKKVGEKPNAMTNVFAKIFGAKAGGKKNAQKLS